MVKLKNELVQNELLAKDLKDGQLAIIIDDALVGHYKGRIVQRYEDSMIAIGSPSGMSWEDITSNTLKVRLLQDGELLVVTNNE